MHLAHNGEFQLGFGGCVTQKFEENMSMRPNVAGPGTPGGIIEYLDFSEQKDNSSFVPNLQKGMFQAVKLFEDDAWLSQIDLEKLVQDAEKAMQGCDTGVAVKLSPKTAERSALVI